MSAFVSKKIDSYVNVYGDNNPMWIVELSNGETVYQDDDRPGIEPPSAWKRLKIYCDAHDLHVVKMNVKNRSHMENVGVIPEQVEKRNIGESLDYLITKNGVLDEQKLQTQNDRPTV